jgi:cell division protein FtsB
MDLQLGPSSKDPIVPDKAAPERPPQRAVIKGLFSGRWENPQYWLTNLTEQGPKAEAVATRWIVNTRPVWSWLRDEWRRVGTLAAVLLTVGLLLHAMFGANGIVVYRQKQNELKDLQVEVDRVGKENEAYASHIKALKTDPGAIEKEAREQLHYTRPGEVIYVGPDAAGKPAVGRAKR